MQAQESIVSKELMLQDLKARNMDKYVEYRLEIWGDWSKRDHHMLGYPQKTIEWRLINEGGVLIKGTGPKYPPTNFMAEEVEYHIKQMRVDKAEYANAVCDKYLADDNTTNEILARRSNMTLRVFQYRLQCGKNWLGPRLTAKNDEKYFNKNVANIVY